jgi:predicted nucleic acid-binding protein
LRVILDTNILISGLISPLGKPPRLIDAWLDGRFTLVSHALQLEEFRAVSRRARIRPLLRPSEAGRLLNRFAALAEPAQGRRRPQGVEDLLLRHDLPVAEMHASLPLAQV